VSLSAKTVRKLELVQDWVHHQRSVTSGNDTWVTVQASNRQLTAVISLLQFAAEVLDVSTVPFYFPMVAYRHACQEGSQGRWEAMTAPLNMKTWIGLSRWVQLAVENTPRPLERSTEARPEFVIFVDASATGWGAVVVQPNGTTKIISQKWPVNWAMHSSVLAESEAMIRAVLATATATTHRILVVTDHEPLMWAWQRPTKAARAWAYNSCLLRICQALPQLTVDVKFLPGHMNFADPPSRGFEMSSAAIHEANVTGKQMAEEIQKTNEENGKTGKSEWALTASNPIRLRCTG